MKKFLQLCGLALGLGLLGVLLSPVLASSPASASQPQAAVAAPATPAPASVVVTNTNANPVLVESVDNPARQTFAVNLCVSGGGYPCSGAISSFTAPPGQHTVIEQVSGLCYSAPGETFLVALQATVDSVQFSKTYLPMTGAPSSPAGNVLIPVSQTRLYPDPGTVVELLYPVAGGVGNWNCYVSLVGYTQKL